MNCIYFLACFCSESDDILNTFSCLLCTSFQYLLYRFKIHTKMHLNSIPIKNLLTFTSVYLVKFRNCYPQLSLEIVSPALNLTQIFRINMNISFLENWKFNHKLLLPLLLTYRTSKSILTIWQNMKVWGIQKFLFSNSLVNWEKFGSTA